MGLTTATAIKFEPFVGPRYRESEVRLLIVGESHHGGPGDYEADFTKSVVQAWVDGTAPSEWGATFTRIATALQDCAGYDVNRQSAFSAIAFMNYCQQLVGGSREAPSDENWRTGERAFREALAALQPTHVWATGRRLWDNMPPFDEQLDDDFFSESEAGIYHEGTRRVYAIGSTHPTGGFSGIEFSKRLKRLLDHR